MSVKYLRKHLQNDTVLKYFLISSLKRNPINLSKAIKGLLKSSSPSACSDPLSGFHSPLDLCCVLVDAFLHLAGVGGDPGSDIICVLLHHGLQLLSVLLHLLPGFAHVVAEFVAQQLHVFSQTLRRLLSVGSQLGLHVVPVHGQF